MSLFEKFKDEADFRDAFIKPLLNRLGFVGVELQHGSQEFGKDFVFSELHRLGGMRNYAAQVKHEAKISQGASVDGLLSQIRQAFAKPFKRTDSPREQHVAAVYVFNSGEITPNAREQMLSELGRERYGDNVHFLDGERLDSLNQWSTYQSDTEARNRLQALDAQLELNSTIWATLHNTLKPGENNPVDARGTFWMGLETYLSQPLFNTQVISLPMLYLVWQRARTIDALRTQLHTTLMNNESKGKVIEKIRGAVGAQLPDVAALRRQIAEAMKKLQPIT